MINDLKKEEGITLIELAVIIVIIAILITTVTARFISYANSVKATACEANMQIISKIHTYYYIQHNEYATSIEDMAEYFQRGLPKCPSEGEYIIHADGQVECTVHGALP